MDPILGTIVIFGFNFTPRGYAACNGALMGIGSNSALFSLLGTYFGGDGVSTFGLPDLQGRVPVGIGNGRGLAPIQIGEMAGSNSVALNVTNLPAHTHAADTKVGVSSANPTSDEPAGNVLTANAANFYAPASSANGALGAVTTVVQAAGNNVPFSVQQPFLGLNFCIATEGVYPSRQ